MTDDEKAMARLLRETEKQMIKQRQKHDKKEVLILSKTYLPTILNLNSGTAVQKDETCIRELTRTER